MKKYVFIVSSISNMGGAQMYLRNKILYLQNNGWTVELFTSNGKNPILPEMKRYRTSYPDLDFCTYYFSKSHVSKLVDSLSEIISDQQYNQIIIESTCISQSTWAELVAKKIHAKHLVYLLQEHNEITNKSLIDFFHYKYKKHEIVGITNQTIPKLLKDRIGIREDDDTRLDAYSTNVEADVDNKYIHIIEKNKNSKIIGCLSRLDKAYVENAVNDIIEYVKNDQNQSYILLLIGDATLKSTSKKLINKCKWCKNLTCIITGFVYPVPTRLLELCDCLIASSGCCWVCARSGVPTISYDGNDFQPIGIINHTTNNSLFRGENEPPVKLNTLLDSIIKNHVYIKQESSFDNSLPDFSDHLDYLFKYKNKTEYYDISKLFCQCRDEIILSSILRLTGSKIYSKLSNYKKIIIEKYGR